MSHGENKLIRGFKGVPEGCGVELNPRDAWTETDGLQLTEERKGEFEGVVAIGRKLNGKCLGLTRSTREAAEVFATQKWQEAHMYTCRNHLVSRWRGQSRHTWCGERWLGVPAPEHAKGACWSIAKKGGLTELAPFFTSLLTDSDQT